MNNNKVTPVPRDVMAKGFTPAGAVAWKIWLGLGAVIASIALSEWFNPSRPPFSGKWSWVKRAAYEAEGDRGLVSFHLALACLALGGAFFLWRDTRR